MPTPQQNILLPLPAALVAPVTTLQTDITQALQDGQGQLANVTNADSQAVVADAQAIITAAQPVIAGSDATQASPAFDAETRAAAAANLFIQPNPETVQLRAINPNLFAIAGQYYNDPSRWQDIADASGIAPPDPQPLGAFTLIVPNS